MDDAFRGINERVIEVCNFDAGTFVGARQQGQPRRGNYIQPVILEDGGPILVPVIAEAKQQESFEDFVRLVVGRSKYRTLVEDIIQSFDQQMIQK